MSYFRNTLRILLITLPLHGYAAESVQVILQNGRSIPASALSLQGDKFVLTAAVEGFTPGQAIPFTMADHIYGDKPAEINQAIALTLTGKPKEAQALLIPVVKEHTITAKIPGNFWLAAARALLVAYAIDGDTADTISIGKEISDATPAQGNDPFVSLGKTLLMPVLTTSDEDRASALSNLTTDNLPAELRAYASFFRGNIYKKAKKSTEALEAYLAVTCLHPSGGLIINAAAELQAADFLVALKRPQEAFALAQSALLSTSGTVLDEEAQKRYNSLKPSESQTPSPSNPP
jgi:tetratricopeptide (TPR) repeat protein